MNSDDCQPLRVVDDLSFVNIYDENGNLAGAVNLLGSVGICAKHGPRTADQVIRIFPLGHECGYA